MDLWSDVFSSVLSDVRALEGLPFRDKAFIEKNDAPQMGKLRCAPPCGAKIDGALANRNRQIGISIRCHHRGRARQCARIIRNIDGNGGDHWSRCPPPRRAGLSTLSALYSTEDRRDGKGWVS